MIIVDDGSTDNSVSIIKDFCQKDNRIKLFTHPNNENKGLQKTLEYGIKLAETEWITLLESDDILAPDYLEQKTEVIKNNNNINLIFNECEIFGDEKRIERISRSMKRTNKKLSKKKYPANMFYDFYCDNNIFTFSSVTAKKSDLLKTDFNTPIDCLLDWWIYIPEGIDLADAEPEHLFEIGRQGVCGVLAGQRGLIAQYAADYPEINYLVKMNSKTNLVKTSQDDPYSPQLYDLDAILAMREAGVNIVGLGYTIYLGSEYESTMMAEAGELIAQAHANGLLVVLWIYPRGKAVTAEKDPDLIAGAAGVALCLGADFVKVNPPKPEGDDTRTPAEALKVASMAAGRTGLVCAGGSTVDAKTFLTQLYDQIHVGGACGNATGRNIHQRSLDEAVRLTKAISAITLADYSVADALAVFNGEKDFSL